MKVVSVEVGSDLYVAGRSDDGTDYTAEVYLVIVEFADGQRWAHSRTFPGCNVEQDEEGYSHFGDIRVAAEADASRLADRVRAALTAGRVLNDAHWNDYYPVYGSRPYLEEVAGMTDAQRAGEAN
jgi:hypothetical protein